MRAPQLRGIVSRIALRRSGYHVNLILTLTINPAVDRIITADRLVFEDRGYILDHSEAAGGRGINASQVVHAFGGKTVAVLTAGGTAGERIQKLLGTLSFSSDIVHVRAETRTNLTISDKDGLTVKLNERGAPLEVSELKEIKKKVEARLPR